MKIWMFDTEVFADDWLFCAEAKDGDERVVVWNDHDTVAEWLLTERPLLCGYNAKAYDMHILRAIVSGYTPREIAEVSRRLVVENTPSLALFSTKPPFKLPPHIDLFHDIVPRKSLKEIEANLGMAVVESPVPFDIDRPLTQGEREVVTRYCLADIAATKALYEHRRAYVLGKVKLAEIAGLDPFEGLALTNARLVAKALRAERLTYIPSEVYEPPDDLDTRFVPQAAIEFMSGMSPFAPPERALEIEHGGLLISLGIGGLHGAIPHYKGESTPTRRLVAMDVASYYPTLMITKGYISRAIPSIEAYKRFYDMRLEAKRSGDAGLADAAKLVLNSTFGASKNEHNPLYDPIQGLRITLTGQLYLLELFGALSVAVPGVVLVQANTDGWILEGGADQIVAAWGIVQRWAARYGLSVEQKTIAKLVQANVNNYVVQYENGTIAVKGRDVGLYHGGTFKSASMPIVSRAVVDYYLTGTPLEVTIGTAQDPIDFQMVAKAGSKFMGLTLGHDVELGKVARVFAAKGDGDTIYKVREVEGERQYHKFPSSPDKCFVENGDLRDEKVKRRVLDKLDRDWYVGYSQAVIERWGI